MTASHTRLVRDLTDLAIGSPFVAGSRLARLATPGALNSSLERREMTRMVFEKQSAAMESFFSLAVSCQRQAMNFWLGATFMQPMAFPSEREMIVATRAALKPYRSRVNANAHRIAKRRRKS